MLTHIFVLFQIINASITQCPRDRPILKNKSCQLIYCSDTDFESRICTIKNSVIKNQWLNNIIFIGAQSFKYINFGEYSNGDMIIEANSPTKGIRMFYGLKNNGRPLFTIETKEASFYSVKDSITQGQDVSEGGIIQNSFSTQDYYFSISKGYNVEIFDIENFKIYTRASSSFSGHNIYSIKPNIFPDKTTNTFFLCFVGKENGGDDLKIYLQKHLFKNLNDVQSEKKAEFSEPNAYGLHISCFQSPKYFLYCLYLTKQNEEIYFNLTKYASNFTNKVS